MDDQFLPFRNLSGTKKHPAASPNDDPGILISQIMYFLINRDAGRRSLPDRLRLVPSRQDDSFQAAFKPIDLIEHISILPRHYPSATVLAALSHLSSNLDNLSQYYPFL